MKLLVFECLTARVIFVKRPLGSAHFVFACLNDGVDLRDLDTSARGALSTIAALTAHSITIGGAIRSISAIEI